MKVKITKKNKNEERRKIKQKTICRSFTLFNDKVLSDYYVCDEEYSKNLEKDYVAIGFFDWFETDVITGLCQESSYYFSELYKHISSLTEKLDGQQTYQNIYGFRKEWLNDRNTSEIDNDENFWNKRKEPLIFISFWQMDNTNCTIDIINTILSDAENNTMELPFIVYSTLDKSDYIICFRANKYSYATELINTLYIKFYENDITTIYSYTNLVVDYKKLNNDDIRLWKRGDRFEIVDSVCIKSVLNNYSGVNIEEKIKNFSYRLASELYYQGVEIDKIKNREIVGYEILGDTDCRFIARDVPLKNILKLFSKNGLLNRNNDNFKYNFLSSMTSLNISYTKTMDKYNDIQQKINDYLNNKQQLISNDINELANLVKLIKKDKYQIVATQLQNILHCLSTMRLSKNLQYEFRVLYSPVSTAIKLINNNIGKETVTGKDIDDLFEYIDKIYIIIQGSMRTDIRFYHLLDYSVMSYYAPSKLKVFYSLLMKNLSGYYIKLCSEEKKKFEFIIFHGTAHKITVKQIRENIPFEDKLMIVNIPERELYNLKTAMFTLAHEVAHFVGNESIRNRKQRFNALVKFLCRIYYKLMCSYIKEDILNKDYKDLFCVAFDERIKFNNLYLLIKNKIDNLVQQAINTLNIDEKIIYYSFNLYKIFEMLFTQEMHSIISVPLLDSIKKSLYRTVYTDIHTDIYKLNKYKKLINNINDIGSSCVMNIHYEIFGKEWSHFQEVKYVVTESYADLSAIISLNLSITDYFDMIFSLVDNPDKNDDNDKYFSALVNKCIFIRCSLVVKALSDVSCQLSTNENLSFLHKSFYDFFNILNYEKNFQNKENHYMLKSKMIKKFVTSNVFELWEDICDYLKICSLSYSKYNQTNNLKDIRESLTQIYHIAKSDDLLSCVNAINNYINVSMNEEIENDNK